ncbi:MAG: hypothetical protein IPP72_14510 [Chitinophagaceae bacterium]|nr:hypothetical protein [Chitinophagaceae bacterium]
MKFTKKHFFLILGINLLLPLLIMMAFNKNNHFNFPETIAAWLIAITVLSFMLFFICWFLYYAFTGGKDPSVKFHLLSQCLMTGLILSLFGYILFDNWYIRNYKANIYHNTYFLATNPNGKLTRYDTLYQKAFVLLQTKMDSRNGIRLERRVSEANDITTDSTGEPVCIFYFVYTLKGKALQYASKHLVGDHTNKMLFYNIAAIALPQLDE